MKRNVVIGNQWYPLARRRCEVHVGGIAWLCTLHTQLEQRASAGSEHSLAAAQTMHR